MTCREYEAELIELARGCGGTHANRHAESCQACAMFLEQQMTLSAVAQSVIQLTINEAAAPPDLEARLLREFEAVRRPAYSFPAARYTAGVALLAAALLLVFFTRSRPAAKPGLSAVRIENPVAVPVATAASPKMGKPRRRARRPAHRQDADVAFVQIPYTQPLAPWERAQVVRMEMPVAALIAAGFPVATSDAAAQAKADVIVGEDGRARAVRLISISERSIEQ